jgi:hypothetical protein
MASPPPGPFPMRGPSPALQQRAFVGALQPSFGNPVESMERDTLDWISCCTSVQGTGKEDVERENGIVSSGLTLYSE